MTTHEKIDIYNYFEDRLLRYIGSADSLFGEEIHALLQSLEDDIQALIESAKREAAIEQVMRDEMTLGLELPITDEQQLIGWRNDTIAELKALKEGK